VERDVFHDETSTGRKSQTRERVEKLRFVFTLFVHSGDKRSTRSNRCDGSSL